MKTSPLTCIMFSCLALRKTNYGTNNNFVTWSSEVFLHQNGQKGVMAARELKSKTGVSLLTKNICRIGGIIRKSYSALVKQKEVEYSRVCRGS